jgi:hypothetical protein
MATDIDILVSQRQTKTKQGEVGLIPLKQIFQKVDFQGATQCNLSCPICQSERQSGACALNAGHAGQHVCNRVSSHIWSGSTPTDVPGPH